MRRPWLLVPVVTLLILPSLAQAGPGPGAAQARLATARFVALGYDNGRGFVPEYSNTALVVPEERRALQAIQDDLEQWGHYIITTRPGQADILIAVRKGRLVEVGPAVGTGERVGLERPGGTSGNIWGAGATLSSPDDMLSVYDRGGMRLWHKMRPGGLKGDPPLLFEVFREDVERAVDRAQENDEEPESPAPEER